MAKVRTRSWQLQDAKNRFSEVVDEASEMVAKDPPWRLWLLLVLCLLAEGLLANRTVA